MLEKPLKRGCAGVESPLWVSRHVHGPKAARAWLGLSLADLGKEVARLTGRPRPYDKGAVSYWERTGRTVADVAQAYAVLIANKLTTLLGRTIGVRIAANSPWDVTAWARCAKCSSWFELKRANGKRCPECVEAGLR